MRDRSAVLLFLLVLCANVRAECPAFTTRQRFYAGVGSPHGVIATDVNHDGKLDVATLAASAVGFQLGHGDGTFQISGPVYPATEAYEMAVGDVNLDGNPDIVTSGVGSGMATVVLGRGDGTGTVSQFPVVTGSLDVAIADVTSDGKPDALFNSLEGGVYTYAGDGQGHFATSAIAAITGSLTPVTILLRDFNGDGKLDLVGAFPDDQTLRTYFGRGDGTFAAGPVAGNVSETARAMVMEDFDRDGNVDLALGSSPEGQGAVYLGTGGGAFRRGAQFTACALTWSMAAADLTNDGKLDLVIGCQYDPYGVRVLIGGGDGTFTGPKVYRNDLAVLAVATGDFDGDHQIDILAADYPNSTIGILANTGDCQSAPGKRRSARH